MSEPARVGFRQTGDDRDVLIARMLLCVHPAIPLDSQLGAILVWALEAEPSLAARATRRNRSRLKWLLTRFERRTKAINLKPTVPAGRVFSARLDALIGLLARAADAARPSHRRPISMEEIELVMLVSAAAEVLANHPLAGCRGAHRLKADLGSLRRALRIDTTLEAWLSLGASQSARLLRGHLPSAPIVA